jgi:hypothetical protein
VVSGKGPYPNGETAVLRIKKNGHRGMMGTWNLIPIKESVSLVWANSASGFGKGNTCLVISEVISSSTKYFKLSLSHSTAKT